MTSRDEPAATMPTPTIPIERDLVPEELRHLADEAERWGSLPRFEQDRRLEELMRHPEAAQEFREAFAGCSDAVVRWAKELGLLRKHLSEFTDSDWRNPYWLYLSTLKVAQNVPVPREKRSPERRAVIETLRLERERETREGDLADARRHFAQGRLAEAGKLLETWEADLSPAQRAKLAYCRKHGAT